MDIKEIQNLIKFVAKSGASEVKLKMKDIKITIRTVNINSAIEPTPIQQLPVSQVPMARDYVTTVEVPTDITTSKDRGKEAKYTTIKSPIIGTFYRKPSPEKAFFVEVGDIIKEGDILCVIEAMKLFNDIESEFSGKIIKILVDDSSPVEFDQPLFLIDPS